jgi:hypothetical protein
MPDTLSRNPVAVMLAIGMERVGIMAVITNGMSKPVDADLDM